MDIQDLIARWDTDEGRPNKGGLINMEAYNENPESLNCMDAQGQLLHILDGWDTGMLSVFPQSKVDKSVAKLLNISKSHSVLLRIVNDSVKVSPSVVLTDPGKVIGAEWSKVLDFWWYLDDKSDDLIEAAFRDFKGIQCWPIQAIDIARCVACGAAKVPAGDATWSPPSGLKLVGSTSESLAANEVQGAKIIQESGLNFYFLPMYGFKTPDDIPPRPADYGIKI